MSVSLLSRKSCFLLSTVSEMHPGDRSDANTTALLREIPVNPFLVYMSIFVEKVNRCNFGSAGCSTQTSVASVVTLIEEYLSKTL